MGNAIGISLGNTNSVMAIKQAENLYVLKNKENNEITPSVVGFHKGQFIVGEPAIDRMVSAPKGTIISIKRLMGHTYTYPDVQKAKDYYQYEIVPSDGKDGDVMVMLGEKQYSPVQISSKILEKLKKDAEVRLNNTVEYAVITVPAYFTDKQRDAARKAGQLAGLKVQKILDEPSAAAVAFGVDNIGHDDSNTILVYDLGGGTLDVSVLTVAGGQFVILDIEGDMWLGGDNFDHMIMDYVVEQVKEIENINARQNLSFMMELKKQAEKAKKSLSSINSTDIVIIGQLKNEYGDLVDVEVELTRSQFERMIEPDVKRSIELVHKAIKNANVTIEQIDYVLLVGGSSTIPMVKRALVDIFGEKKVLINVDPMKCVAQGAAIMAEMLREKIECRRCKHLNPVSAKVCEAEGCGEPLQFVHEITGRPYGIRTVDDKFIEIIPKCSNIPSAEPSISTFYTPQANVKRIKIPVYAGFDNVASKNELQGILWLELPENVPENTRIDLAFELDINGIIKVRASLMDGSGREVNATIDRDLEFRRVDLERKLDEVKSKVDKKESDIDFTTKEKIEKVYNDEINALTANNIDAAEKKIKEMEKELEKIDIEESDWKKKAKGITGYAEVTIQQYRWMIDPLKINKIEKLMKELNEAVEKDNQQVAETKHSELNKELDNLGLASDLMFITIVINIASEMGEMGDYVSADKLRSGLSEIEDAAKNGNRDAINRKFEELKPIIDKIIYNMNSKSEYLLHANPYREKSSQRRGNLISPCNNIDLVHFSMTSPQVVKPATSFVIYIWAHLERQRDIVIQRAQEVYADGKISIQSKGPIKVTRGTLLSVRLKLEGLIVENPEDTILWEGEIGNAMFLVKVPEGAKEGFRSGVATIYIDGMQILRLYFVIQIGATQSKVESIPTLEERYRKAFPSYSSKDRDAVLGRIQGIQKIAPYLEFNMDVIRLRSGQYWEQELWKIIPQNDIFYLFWSKNACKSEWVEKEWRCALKTKGIDFIDPVPLVSPDEVPPPTELAGKHFNDWVLAFMRGKNVSSHNERNGT